MCCRPTATVFRPQSKNVESQTLGPGTEHTKKRMNVRKRKKIMTEMFTHTPSISDTKKTLSTTEPNTETKGHCRKCNLHYSNWCNTFFRYLFIYLWTHTQTHTYQSQRHRSSMVCALAFYTFSLATSIYHFRYILSRLFVCVWFFPF